MIRRVLRAVGRAALDGLSTENGWCWVWGFGPAPRYRDVRGAPTGRETARRADDQ